MKKFTTILLTVFFLVIQTKMIQNIHLCGGNICSIQTFVEKKQNSCCHTTLDSCCATNEEDNNCCKDIVLEHDIDDVKIEKFNIDFLHSYYLEKEISFTNTALFNAKSLKINAFAIQSNAPPLYKLYQQFIFYA